MPTIVTCPACAGNKKLRYKYKPGYPCKQCASRGYFVFDGPTKITAKVALTREEHKSGVEILRKMGMI